MFYEAVQTNRLFDKERRYADIDWTRLDPIIDGFEKRIRDWYLEPATELAKNVHFAFSVMALDCLLIDTLSQFASGSESSDRKVFKQFIRDKLPKYAGPLLQPIRHVSSIQHEDGTQTSSFIDVAEVLYHGYRCGILHQAHITLYGLVDPGASAPVSQHASGHLRYKSDGSDCVSVVLNPLKLLDDLSGVFRSYLDDLKNRDTKHDQLRVNFKKKFSKSFGVDVSSAA